MFCRNCGHQNPEQNRFCGRCGSALAPERVAEPESVVEKVPITVERTAGLLKPSRTPEAPRHVAGAAEPVETRHEPEQPKPVAPVAEAARRGDQGRAEEKEITVSGPSFLGLSSSDSGAGTEYSHLFEEEPQSHIGSWVLVVLVLVLGGVLYAKWQPIRDYVLGTPIAHSQSQQQPALDPKSTQSSAAGASAPTTPLAASDAASQPAITTENKTEQNKAAQPLEALPQTDKESFTASKPDDSAKTQPAGASSERAAAVASKQPGARPAAANDKVSANRVDDKSANAADLEKPSAAQKARPPQGDAAGELVSSGEKYLYGRGVARNCGQAVSYFNAAAAQQNPQAFSHLGALYATGECVPMDRAVAYAWFRRAYAKEPGNRYFEQNLTMLWKAMTPRERQRATGRQ